MATKVKLAVTGLKCGGCEKTVTEKLTALAGVLSVQASHAGNTVEVEYDAAVVEEDDLIECIEEAGFTVED
ncbi:MAG: mercuric reductase [Methyloprofundus sp.]|nr:mercuric reductase [Methyloprofundus sp.]